LYFEEVGVLAAVDLDSGRGRVSSVRSSLLSVILAAAMFLLQPVQLGRSGDGYDPGLARKQPGERDLRRQVRRNAISASRPAGKSSA
jgi:hypothetical protein